jgi:hypothetical protein
MCVNLCVLVRVQLDYRLTRMCRGRKCVDGSFPDFFTGLNSELLRYVCAVCVRMQVCVWEAMWSHRVNTRSLLSYGWPTGECSNILKGWSMITCCKWVGFSGITCGFLLEEVVVSRTPPSCSTWGRVYARSRWVVKVWKEKHTGHETPVGGRVINGLCHAPLPRAAPEEECLHQCCAYMASFKNGTVNNDRKLRRYRH